jgi:small nuclear ribonucleoprotein (snRNP)-like protein
MTSPQEKAALIETTVTNEQGIAMIETWLNQRLRITITDERSFEGWFKCVDRDCNIVLAGSEEYRDGIVSA